MSNQTPPRVSPGLHHNLMYSFLESHSFEDAPMQNAMCLSSVFGVSVFKSTVALVVVVVVVFWHSVLVVIKCVG